MKSKIGVKDNLSWESRFGNAFTACSHRLNPLEEGAAKLDQQCTKSWPFKTMK